MTAPVRIPLSGFKWILGLWLLFAATLANAQGVQLRDAMSVTPPPAAMAATAGADEWTWLGLREPQRLRKTAMRNSQERQANEKQRIRVIPCHKSCPLCGNG